MSLVAAYSDSDESDNESDVEKQSSVSKSKLANSGCASKVSNGENDLVTVGNEIDLNQSCSESLPNVPSAEEPSILIKDEDDWIKQVNNDEEKELKSEERSTLFSLLPQPKSKETCILEETDDEFIKKKKSKGSDITSSKSGHYNEISEDSEKNTKRGLLNLPKPTKKGEKRRVKISIPSLEEIGAESESDDEELKNNRIKIESKKKSTLFAILPKPRHSVAVCSNKNKVFLKETNRPLVPHTLTKKKEPMRKGGSDKIMEKKPIKGLVNVDVSDSDNEDQDDVSSNNFFSFNTPSSTPSVDKDAPGDRTSNIVDSGINLHKKQRDSPHPEVCKESQFSTVDQKQASIFDSKKSSVNGNTTKTNSFFSNLFNSNKINQSKTRTHNSDKQNDSKNSGGCVNENMHTGRVIENSRLATNLHSSITTSSDSSINSTRQLNTAVYDKSNPTQPHSDVTAPYGNVTKAYPNIVKKTESVTAPYGDVTAPYENVTKAYPNIVKKTESVTAPYGDVTAPYENLTAPYGSVSKPYGNLSIPYGTVTEPYLIDSKNNVNSENHTGGKSYPSSQHFFSFSQQNASKIESVGVNTEDASSMDYYNKPNEDLPIEKEALQALQGRKRKKEEIKLFDVNADDIQANNLDHLKNMTAPSGYKSQSSKKDQPSSSQKRKHQITYLAFQAKERELQLQQSWADNRATRKETQSKYGF